MPPKLLSLNDMADRTGFTRRYFEKLVKDGTIPSVKIGNATRVLETDFTDWLTRETGHDFTAAS